MQLDWIKTFVAVVDHRGFAHAAIATHRSQSRISAHVAALESALGIPLFDRHARPVRLTEAGLSFLGHARAVLARIEESKADISALKGLMTGSITLGTYASVSSGFLPNLIVEFGRRHPDVRISLFEGSLQSLEEAVLNHGVDLAFRPLRAAVRHSALKSTTLWREKVQAVLLPSHPLAEGVRHISGRDLVTENLITPKRSPQDAWTFLDEVVTAKQGRRFETDNPQALVEFVRRGLGVGVTNELALSVSDLTGVVIRTVAEPTAFRDVGLFWSENAYLSNAALAMYECILEIDKPCQPALGETHRTAPTPRPQLVDSCAQQAGGAGASD